MLRYEAHFMGPAPDGRTPHDYYVSEAAASKTAFLRLARETARIRAWRLLDVRVVPADGGWHAPRVET